MELRFLNENILGSKQPTNQPTLTEIRHRITDSLFSISLYNRLDKDYLLRYEIYSVGTAADYDPIIFYGDKWPRILRVQNLLI